MTRVPSSRPARTSLATPAPRRRLRVLHMLPTLGLGGAEHMACHLATAMTGIHDLGVVSLYPQWTGTLEMRLEDAQIPVWHLDKRPGFDFRLFGACDRVIREFHPDVVHTHMSVLRYALPSLIHRRVPLVVHTLHSLAQHETDAVGRMVHWLAFRGRVIPVAISREVAASAERTYGVPCRHLVPNCIPVEAYRFDCGARARWRTEERIEAAAVVFTSVARLEAVKNPFLLLEAFTRLGDPRARLLLLGRGEMRDRVNAWVRERRLEHTVRVMGHRDDVRECLSASDVFVLSSNCEGNPLAVMEAMAAGLPVISTAVGGVPELVDSGRSGILVGAGDCGAFTAAMRYMLDRPEERAEMAEAARDHAWSHFGLDRMVEGYLEIYEAAMVKS
jgi:glycosyltransferase involved in cell wall biosynthesis